MQPIERGSAFVVLVVLAAMVPVSAQHGDSGDSGDPPRAAVQALHDALVEAAGSGDALSAEERYALIEPVVAATHDLPYIAEVTVRRQWRNLDESERAAFVAAFERLSIMTYATRFASIGTGSFAIYGSEDAGGGRKRVSAAIIRPEGDDIPLDYVLHEAGGRWRIVNILADRVSDLALKRAQYQQIFADGGTIGDVIAEIEKETAGL